MKTKTPKLDLTDNFNAIVERYLIRQQWEKENYPNTTLTAKDSTIF